MMKRICFWLVVTIFAAGLFVSCGNKNKERDSVEVIVERVWQFGQSHPDGFTVDICTLQEPTEGIAVAYAATQGCHSRETLAMVVRHALEHDGYVGGWFDSESGLYFFDSTRLFPEDQFDEALAFARENGQSAVYILSSSEEVYLGELQTAA